MINKIIVCFFIFLCAPLFLVGQNDNDFLKGFLLEASTREPIPFATIRIKDKAVGVISNNDGSFRIPKSFQEKGDFLEISSMGYESITIAIASLNENRLNLFFLKPAVYELNETVVKGTLKTLSAKDIIRYAINNIKVNYPQDKFAYVGYYRDYQTKENQYVNLNEAIVKVLDKGFNTIDTLLSDFLIYDYRKNKVFEIDSFAAKPYNYEKFDKVVPWSSIRSYGGNELVLLRVHDAIRNHRIKTFSYVYQLSKDFIDNHYFSIKRTTYYDNKPVYEIAIFKKNERFRVGGFIYIDKESFAIRKLDYAVYKSYQNTKILESETHYKGDEDLIDASEKDDLLFEVQTEYREAKDQKLYLNYISFHNMFTITRPPKFGIAKIVLNDLEKQIEIAFNRNAENHEELKLKDFKFSYQTKKVDLAKLVTISPKQFILKVDVKKSKKQQELLEMLFSRTYDPDKRELLVQIKSAMDKEGNLINEQESETLNQFREFFTQEVVPYPGRTIPKDSLMIKTTSMGNDQPIFNLEHRSQYWMNTPLKKMGNKKKRL